MAAAVGLLGLSWTQGGILGFTIAVVSPAVVVPTMIRLKESGWGATLGKATVQATPAPLVIALGVRNGQTILAVAVMSILMMAPLASLAIEFTYGDCSTDHGVRLA